MRPLVLTSTRPAGASSSEEDAAPRIDFEEIARALGGCLSYPPASGGGLMSRLEARTASDLRQAWVARCTPASLFLSLSEKVGVPLALLNRGRAVPHLLLAHHLTSERKRMLQRRTGVLRRFAGILVLCRAQERYLREEVGLPPERVHFVYDKVDHRFWTPCAESPRAEPYGGETFVLSVGRERRDYETLMAAVEPLGVPTVIVASSPWSRQGEGESRPTPANVTLRRGLRFAELRDLYAAAALVVVPLQPGTDYAAGVNAVLEAQAMQKPLLVTSTPGIADYVEDGVNARAVPPNDPQALGAAITDLLEDRALAQRLAGGGRRVVEAGRNLDAYVRSVTQVAREVLGQGRA